MLTPDLALAVVASALASALVCGPAPPALAAPGVSRWWGPAVLVPLVALLPPGTTALALIGTGVAAGAVVLRRQRAAAARASTVADGVLECCEALAAELSAGRPPGAALREAARTWSGLGTVTDVFELGGDVPAALRGAAGQPGAEGLRFLAAAWIVSERTGAGLADGARSAAARVRRRHDLHRTVAAELASARTTARLMATLPVLVLLMGSGAGGDPWGFLVGTPVGLGCLAAGSAFAGAGLWWLEAIAAGVER